MMYEGMDNEWDGVEVRSFKAFDGRRSAIFVVLMFFGR